LAVRVKNCNQETEERTLGITCSDLRLKEKVLEKHEMDSGRGNVSWTKEDQKIGDATGKGRKLDYVVQHGLTQ